MPKVIDKCVNSLVSKSDFKSKEGKTKKESAYAICTKMHKDGKLTEANDEEMKVVFATWKKHLKFDEEITTVAEQLGQNKAFQILRDHVWAFQDTIDKILLDEDVKDKGPKIMSQIEEFAKLVKAEIEELGDFVEQKAEIIAFTGEIGDYEVVDNDDGTVTINHLPIFQLGTHRGYPYDEDWAKNKALSLFNKDKETGYMPPLIIDHTDEKGTSKPAKGFMDNLRLEGNLFYIDALKVPEEDARGYPYRSVEISPDSKQITALALTSTKRPYFKFEPVMFGEKKEGKHDGIILTFFDKHLKERGGEKMTVKKDEKLEQQKKTLLGSISGAIEKFISKEDPLPKPEVFTEGEVKEKEKVAAEKAKKDAQVQFLEDQKKGELDGFFADLFGGNGKKEGRVLAPHLKPRVKAFVEALDNQPTIKFTEETEKEGKKVKTEVTISPFEVAKGLFNEILNGENTVVELGEKTRFVQIPSPEESKDDKFNEELGKKVAKKYSAKKKEKE